MQAGSAPIARVYSNYWSRDNYAISGDGVRQLYSWMIEQGHVNIRQGKARLLRQKTAIRSTKERMNSLKRELHPRHTACRADSLPMVKLSN